MCVVCYHPLLHVCYFNNLTEHVLCATPPRCMCGVLSNLAVCVDVVVVCYHPFLYACYFPTLQCMCVVYYHPSLYVCGILPPLTACVVCYQTSLYICVDVVCYHPLLYVCYFTTPHYTMCVVCDVLSPLAACVLFTNLTERVWCATTPRYMYVVFYHPSRYVCGVIKPRCTCGCGGGVLSPLSVC